MTDVTHPPCARFSFCVCTIQGEVLDDDHDDRLVQHAVPIRNEG